MSTKPFAGATLAPTVAALIALAVHGIWPDGQLPALDRFSADPWWRHPYPLCLFALVAVGWLAFAAAALRPSWRPWLTHQMPLLAAAVGVFALWEVLTLKLNWLVLPFFPGPDAVLAALVEDAGTLLDNAGHSLLLVATGYFAGVAAGLCSGVLIGWYPRVRYWGMPFLKIVGPIPATALVPLVMNLSVEAFVPAAALIAFAVWFPVTTLTASGIAGTRVAYLDVARTLGAGQGYLVFRVALPAAMPHIFLGLFMGLGASFLTLIVAETVGVRGGLGWYLNWQKGYAEYAKVDATLLIIALFFSTLMTALFKVRDRVLKWQKGIIRW